LHRRAGFAATWAEVQRDLKDGPEASVSRLLRGKARSGGVPSEFEQVAGALAMGAVSARDPERLQAWWVYRMLCGPDALGERLTLLWHNHFATSNLKVNDLGAMRRQNDSFRRLARGPFGKLLNEAVRDPALLVWLDAPANRKAHPNENLARELMELFTLGVGNYSEKDVKEAARALTGWSVVSGAFQELPGKHDSGEKVILGKKGRWSGTDLVNMLLEHPATAQRLARRLCEVLLAEGVAEPRALDALARGLRERDLDVGWGVETVLRSQLFFSDANLKGRISTPSEFLVGSARALEALDPPPSTLELARWLTRLGEDLFYPPNVGGWPGGRSWITTQTAISRLNYVRALLEGKGLGGPEPFDALGLATRHGHARTLKGVVEFYAKLLLGVAPGDEWSDGLLRAAHSEARGEAPVARRVVFLMLTRPEASLV
jgi:uncharacterized protein (DUF1800 family)